MPWTTSYKRVAEPTRHELGQWFTPEAVADLALALALRGASGDAKVLDPSCGDGVFLQRAVHQGIAASRLYGVDIDPQAIGAAQAALPAATLVHADFFDAANLPAASRLRQVDVIVGNPPYVRQERLDASAKSRIVDALASDWPRLARKDLVSLVGRGDLAAPFLLRTLHHLKKGGTAALVISSAFLDSAYGEQFWKLLEQVASLELLVDAPRERWFQDAAVNAVIAVFRAGPPAKEICLARLRSSTRDAAKVVSEGGELSEVAELRFASCTEPTTWAAALRAPDAWFQFVAEAGDALTTLGEVAEIRRGVTSGANDIFYLRREQTRDLEIPKKFLLPLLRAPGRAGQNCIAIDDKRCLEVALVLPPETKLGAHPALLRYLDSFEGAAQRRTLSARDPWWALPVRPAQVFLSKAYAQRFVQPYSPTALVADQRVYCVHPVPEVAPELLSAILNSTMTSLALESLGRASMGEGALEWTVGDARRLPILDPRKISAGDSVMRAFAAMAGRPIGSVQSEAGLADRSDLDASLLGAWPGLATMRDALEEALVQTCDARQRRAHAALV
jgi:hypothetical protein